MNMYEHSNPYEHVFVLLWSSSIPHHRALLLSCCHVDEYGYHTRNNTAGVTYIIFMRQPAGRSRADADTCLECLITGTTFILRALLTRSTSKQHRSTAACGGKLGAGIHRTIT